jgi:hypothetical protein
MHLPLQEVAAAERLLPPLLRAQGEERLGRRRLEL